jgi:acyl phosphate:glycerol-3-phosphate acyltransferase
VDAISLLETTLIAYLVGSFPSGYLAGRMRGIDIRQVGSGNVGATNVTRVLGKRFGYLVFAIDFLKGIAAVLVSIAIAERARLDSTAVDCYAAAGGVFCVIGHSYPVCLGFKGGKGVATSLGVIFAISWAAAVVMGVIWLTLFKLTRYVSLASIAAAVGLPIIMTAMLFWHQLRSPIPIYFSLCLAAIVVFRHRANLARLRDGTEPRFVRK